ncbi:isopentenyl-diphosphate delta-isomerase [bacterium BMS3Abin04]|nr:isopentenyl-diphosphate delta-isomerase [bacterium BMS3Abin04]
MKKQDSKISRRKKEHLDIVLNKNVSFISKTTGFEKYDFIHYALTEIDLNKIDLSTYFFNKKISFPFMISSMTGGTSEANSLNADLAIVANELNIPIGVGSQRQAIEDSEHHTTYSVIRENAPSIPVVGNIGASEIATAKNINKFQKLIDLIEADAFIVHLNPLQELLQHDGNMIFKGLYKNLEVLVKTISVPVIVKEVGAGISKKVAKQLLEIGVKGIDTAGAGGTSWAGIEIIRSNRSLDNPFWDWGLPTSYCIRKVSKLKKEYNFTLIASGGIKNGFDAAKAFALGADIAASAKTVLKILAEQGIINTIDFIIDWHETIKKIMFLTGSEKLSELNKSKLIRKKELY